MSDNDIVNNAELKQYIEVWENLNSEIADLREQLKEHKKAGKGDGFDNKICNKIIKDRARERSKVEEERTLIEIYEAALNGE